MSYIKFTVPGMDCLPSVWSLHIYMLKRIFASHIVIDCKVAYISVAGTCASFEEERLRAKSAGTNS